MAREVQIKGSNREEAFKLWIKAPNPMVNFFKNIDISNLIKISNKKNMKLNMLLNYCIGKAAFDIKEFYLLPVGDKLIKFDTIAVNTIIKNKNDEINSCDILYLDNLEKFSKIYEDSTSKVIDNCENIDLSKDSMVIGTSAIVETELDGAVGMNSGIYNNPFIIWGKYKKKWFKYYLPISFQFHHAQMDGLHAGKFLENLQKEVDNLNS